MRNQLTQPAPLDLPPVEITPIRIYGQLIGPMQRPESYVKILLKAITTTQQIVQDTWSECTTDQAGNYDFSVNPGKYAVFFERAGIKTRVNNIQVYSDSAPGPLQTFMLSPAPELLTPLVVQEVKAALELASAAVVRSRQWAENPVDVPVLDFEQGAGPEYSAYHWAHKIKEMIDTDTNINWRGEWSSMTAYAFRDAVRYQGSAYYCVEANTGQTPPSADVADSEFWSLMARKGDASTVPGPANTLTIGTVTAVPYGTPPSAEITGTPPNQILNLELETGPQGVDSTIPGPANTLTIGTVTAVPYGTPPGATITGASPNQTLNLTLETGPAGANGSAIVDPGAVGSWALVSVNELSTTFTYGQSVAASELCFVAFRLSETGPDWELVKSSTSPAGTWRVSSDVPNSGYYLGVAFVAQRIA